MIRAIPYTSLWFGVIVWAVVTTAIFFGTAHELRENFLFAYHSQPVEATVDGKYETVSHGRGGRSYSDYLEYHYQVDGIRYDCKSRVKAETYASVADGGTMPLLCATADSSDHRIELPAEISQTRLITFLAVSACLLFAIGGAITINYYAKRNEIYRYLRASGLTTNGSVANVFFDATGRSGDIKMYYLAFTFCDDTGKEVAGRTWYLKPGEESFWREGSTIHVYFDPHHAEHFTVDLDRGSRSY